MARFSSKCLAVVVAVAVVAMAAQLAVAQNEGRRGREGRGRGPGGPGGFGGPPSMASLTRVEQVQEALKLTDDQKKKIEKINADLRKEMREAMEGGRPDPEKMKKMREGVSEKLNGVLDADQQKRLTGIFGAVMDPVVGKAIDLTSEQKDKLAEAMGAPPERRDRGEGREGRGGEDRRARMEKEVLAVLTPDQQKKLEELKGEKVEIDMSAFRGPGDGREGRGRDRGGRRGQSREESKSESSS